MDDQELATEEGWLTQLVRASRYAADLRSEKSGNRCWLFALEIGTLRTLGCADNDLRWLVKKNFARHAYETTVPGDDERTFREADAITFSENSCFVLTSAGVKHAMSVLGALTEGNPQIQITPNAAATDGAAVGDCNAFDESGLVWDRDRREFRINGQTVKVFRVPARNQQMVLEAFHEEGWPPRIDDPLPPSPTIDSKRRLHDTIASLNRKQCNRLIRFIGDGSGTGIRWEIITTPR